MNTDVCIIGAGFAGIGAGFSAKNEGRDLLVFEAANDWGGLCGNFVVDGFRFDKAVHLSFADDPLCQKLFFSQPHYSHLPEASNYKNGCWVRNPVQNNLRFLPVKERIAIIESFAARKKADSPLTENYREWLELQFGQYFTDNYSELYTRKYWATNSVELSCDWCGKRIYQPSLDEVLEGAFPDADEPENVYYAKIMRYPKNGGFRSFVKEAVDSLDIRYGKEAVAIDAKERIVRFSDGAECKYNILVSTLPMPKLVQMMGAGREVLDAASKLKTTSMALVSVGFNKLLEFPALWFYVYDEDIPFARVHSPSMKSPNNAPPGKSSLQFEIYYSDEFPLKSPDDDLVQDTLDAMERMGLAKREDVIVSEIHHEKYANVMFYVGMKKYRDFVGSYIRGQGIISCGRFGTWDYLWTHQSFLSGYHALERTNQ